MPEKNPIIRLKPKVSPKRIRHGFPWLYDNELVTDRRTKALKPGSLAVLQDHAKNELGLFAVNPNSKIFGRKLSTNTNTSIDTAWFLERILSALRLRTSLYDKPYYRLVHAEADELPGLIIDRFSDLLVVQPNAAWLDCFLPELIHAIKDAVAPKNIIINGTSRSRALEGLPETRTAIFGEMPNAPIKVPMNGAIYFADVVDGQKTGLFYDQRPTHAFVQCLAHNKKVLDVFSHVGGFGLAAMANGATEVTFIDGSKSALGLATMGAKATNSSARIKTIKEDAFNAMAELAEKSESYDIVICDPPAFAPKKASVAMGLRAYERVARLACLLVNDGGYLTLCSCSHAVDMEKFRAACYRGIGRGGRSGQIIYSGSAGPDHPLHMSLSEISYLKTLVFRLQ